MSQSDKPNQYSQSVRGASLVLNFLVTKQCFSDETIIIKIRRENILGSFLSRELNSESRGSIHITSRVSHPKEAKALESLVNSDEQNQSTNNNSMTKSTIF